MYTTLACCSFFITSISLRISSTETSSSLGVALAVAFMTLMAYSLRVVLCTALHTTAYPPVPSTAFIS